MWPRYAEMALALWLVLSPFVLPAGFAEDTLATSAVVSGVLVGLFALLSFEQGLRRLHLASLAVGAWLTLFGYLSTRAEATAPAENHVVVGLLLLMFALLPSEASLPPRSWRERFVR